MQMPEMDLIQICMEKNLRIDDDAIHVTIPWTSKMGFGSEPAFLSNIVNDGTNHWIFQVMDRTQYCDLYVGIWEDKNHASLVTNQSIVTNNVYLLSTKFSELRGNFDKRHYFGRFMNEDYESKTVDTIEMMLEFMWDSEVHLKYVINGEDCGTAFVLDPGEYRAVIAFC